MTSVSCPFLFPIFLHFCPFSFVCTVICESKSIPYFTIPSSYVFLCWNYSATLSVLVRLCIAVKVRERLKGDA